MRDVAWTRRGSGVVSRPKALQQKKVEITTAFLEIKKYSTMISVIATGLEQAFREATLPACKYDTNSQVYQDVLVHFRGRAITLAKVGILDGGSLAGRVLWSRR